MKKIIIVQTGIGSIAQIKECVANTFPKLNAEILFGSDFELSLSLIPKNEEVVVIASNIFHDDNDVSYTCDEKTGDKFAEIIKSKINKLAKVYIFSSYPPKSKDWIDGFYEKKLGGWHDGEEIIEAFYEFGIAKRPTMFKKIIKEIREVVSWMPLWAKIICTICLVVVITSLIKLIQLG